MRKTIDGIKKQVWENSLHTCEYISGIAQPGHKIKLRCVIHNIEFEVNYDAIRKSTRKHHICPQCKQEESAKNQVDLVCDYCGKHYRKALSKSTKSDYHFCCRACKDNAQRINSGEKFNDLRPDHYSDGKSLYRLRAFEAYPHKCEICDWDEDEDCLEVHHIDENRKNGSLDNLIILCSICHRKLTIGKYYLDREHKKIIKKGC